jgi:hypothetical protein
VDRAALSPQEAAAVLRRAAELQATELDRSDALDTAAVVQLGRELGLREDAVRSALREHRPPSPPASARPVLLGLDAEVLVRRRVAAGPEAVQAHVGAYLDRQCMQRQRSRADATRWRPRRGLLADLRRGLDLGKTLELKGVETVEVRTAPSGAGTEVEVAGSVSGARSEALGMLVVLPSSVVAGIGVVIGMLTGPEALLALPVAGAAGGAGWLGARAVVDSRRRQVAEALEGVLDGLPPG